VQGAGGAQMRVPRLWQELRPPLPPPTITTATPWLDSPAS
jgi:hypothetical protein